MPNKPLKILVVDDDPAVANALGRGLRNRHELTIETDPELADRRLRDGEWFDVVVCDTNMPRLGGRQLLAIARELPDPPIFVLMSGDHTIRDVHADMTLHKPFSASQLLDVVTILARRRSCATTRVIPRAPFLPAPTR